MAVAPPHLATISAAAALSIPLKKAARDPPVEANLRPDSKSRSAALEDPRLTSHLRDND